MVFDLFKLCAALSVVGYFLGTLRSGNSLRLEECSLYSLFRSVVNRFVAVFFSIS